MSDRYLYKAKRTDNRGWVEGYYAFIDGVHYIYTGALCNGGLYVVAERFEVDPSTLCQYTGLPDKNGKKIWENDIVKVRHEKYSESPDTEFQQYRALGTLEELREAREKQVPKKPIDCVEKYLTGRKNYFYRCSCCDKVVDDTFDKYCRFCGQAIDWSPAEF